jgi:hypothetical protein
MQRNQLNAGVPRNAGVVALTITLFIACVVLTIAFFAVDVVNSMNVAGCDSGCNIGVAQAALLLTPIAGAIMIVLAVIVTIVLAIARRRIRIPHAVALALIVVTFVVSTILINASL